jgi:hypothetical protein
VYVFPVAPILMVPPPEADTTDAGSVKADAFTMITLLTPVPLKTTDVNGNYQKPQH